MRLFPDKKSKEASWKIGIYVRLGFLLGFTIFIFSCSFGNHISRDVVDYNLALEKAAHQSILYNILRAKERKPLHFTALSQIRGTLKFQAGAGANAQFPFGSDAQNIFTVSPNASLIYSTSPVFDVAVLDSQKFMQGILTPVEMKVLDHYWEQGWPREILLHMFIRRIEFSKNINIVYQTSDKIGDKIVDKTVDKNYEEVLNYPGDKETMRAFQLFIRWLLEKGLRIGKLTTEIPIGPPILKKEINLEQMVNAAKEKLSLKKTENLNYFQLQKKIQSIVFCISVEKLNNLKLQDLKAEKVYGKESDVINLQNRTCKSRKDKPPSKEEASKGIITLPFTPKMDNAEQKKDWEEDVKLRDGSNIKIKIPLDTHFVFYLRSIEGMIYYLGEITRALENVPPNEVEIFLWKDLIPLFVLMTGESNTEFEAGVNFEGKRYGIPRNKEKAGRSMHVLSLIGQLLALNKSADEIPSTRAVSIVGP